MFKPEYTTLLEAAFFCHIKDQHELFLEIRDAFDLQKIVHKVECELVLSSDKTALVPRVKTHGGKVEIKLSDLNPNIKAMQLVFNWVYKSKASGKEYRCVFDARRSWEDHLNMPFTLDKNNSIIFS